MFHSEMDAVVRFNSQEGATLQRIHIIPNQTIDFQFLSFQFAAHKIKGGNEGIGPTTYKITNFPGRRDTPKKKIIIK